MGNGVGGDRDADLVPYDGPYVHSRHGTRGLPWVWIANGIRPLDEVFAPPIDSQPTATVQLSPASPDAGPGGAVHVDAGGEDSPGAVIVRVLGPVEVEGWLKVPDRAIVTELACYLALHPERAISGDELRCALRPETEADLSAKSLRSYMSLLRAALGGDLLPAGTAEGYRISPRVTTDWGSFERLIPPGAGLDDLVRALKLVRGRPFAGVGSPGYAWVYSELLMSRIEVTIAAVGVFVSDCYIRLGDIASANWAARQGLAGVPSDIGLWEHYLATARAIGPTEWSAARKEARAALGDGARDLLGKEPTAVELATRRPVEDAGEAGP